MHNMLHKVNKVNIPTGVIKWLSLNLHKSDFNCNMPFKPVLFHWLQFSTCVEQCKSKLQWVWSLPRQIQLRATF